VNADEFQKEQEEHREWEELLASDPGYFNWIESLNSQTENGLMNTKT